MPYKDKNKRREYQKKYRKKYKDKINAYQRKYNKKEEVSKYQKEYQKNYKDGYRKKNKIKIKKGYEVWKDNNPDYQKNYRKIRRKKDRGFAIKERLRWSLRQLFRRYIKENKKSKSEVYGINFLKIIEHLKPFPKNLDNYEIHHIKPLNSFEFINEKGKINLEEIKKAFAPENHKLVTIKQHKKIHSGFNKNGR